MASMIKNKKIILIILFLLLIVVAYTKITQQVELDALMKERARLEADIKRLELLKESLQEELENAASPEFVEEIAREKLRMVKPDEMIFIIHDKNFN